MCTAWWRALDGQPALLWGEAEWTGELFAPDEIYWEMQGYLDEQMAAWDEHARFKAWLGMPATRLRHLLSASMLPPPRGAARGSTAPLHSLFPQQPHFACTAAAPQRTRPAPQPTLAPPLEP